MHASVCVNGKWPMINGTSFCHRRSVPVSAPLLNHIVNIYLSIGFLCNIEGSSRQPDLQLSKAPLCEYMARNVRQVCVKCVVRPTYACNHLKYYLEQSCELLVVWMQLYTCLGGLDFALCHQSQNRSDATEQRQQCICMYEYSILYAQRQKWKGSVVIK